MRAMKLFGFGLGYSAQTLVREHGAHFSQISGTVRSAEKAASLRAVGIEAYAYAGGEPGPELQAALKRADGLLVSAAPDEKGDPMLRQWDQALHRADALKIVVYLSTVGVYGDYGGHWIDETDAPNPLSERGQRRIRAENVWSDFGIRKGVGVQLHRLAGIYGPGRSVLDDLKEGTARRIIKPGQVFNRIHVSDIAGASMAGLMHPHISGAFNICDDEPCPPQDVVCFAASLLGIAPPPEVPFENAQLSEMGRSFYSESKRCANRKLKAVLGYQFRFPTYREGLQSLL
jgi:nucleoside-diphosphate-sugar epimerase